MFIARIPLITSVLVAIALLGAPASGDDFGSIVGRVTFSDGSPVTDAIVIVLQTRRAATVDSLGSFRIDRVPPGQYVLQTRRAGFLPVEDTVLVVTGTAAQCRLSFRRRPFRPHIPDSLIERLQGAVWALLYRLDASSNSPVLGPDNRISGLIPLGRGIQTQRTVSLRNMLADERSYLKVEEGTVKVCSVQYHHGIRLIDSDGREVECAVCFGCKVLLLTADDVNERWIGDFDPIEKQLATVFQEYGIETAVRE